VGFLGRYLSFRGFWSSSDNVSLSYEGLSSSESGEQGGFVNLLFFLK
jgi:hypothetical protein